MVKENKPFVAELWSQAVLDEFKKNVAMAFGWRTKGERLMRAVAMNASQEEIDKIESGELYEYEPDGVSYYDGDTSNSTWE